MSCTASLCILTASSIESNPGCWRNHNAARPSTCCRCSLASQRPRKPILRSVKTNLERRPLSQEKQSPSEGKVTESTSQRQSRCTRVVARTKLTPTPPHPVAGNNWYNAIELSWMILARMLNVWLLLLASFSFLCTKGVDPANPSTSTKTNLLHTPPFVGLLHGASPACCFCRCCGLTKDHTVQCVYLSSCFGIIKLVGCVQETNGQYVSDLAFCFCLAEPIPHLLYLQSLEG